MLFCGLAAISLSACQKNSVPADVRAMVAKEFSEYDKIHIQRRGTFLIKATTPFCSFRDSLDLDGVILRDAIEHHGQVWQSQRTNGIVGETPGCDQSDAVILYGYQTDNLHGHPYRLVLAAWQNDAVWVGVLSRRNGSRPGVLIAPVDATPAMVVKDFNRERRLRRSIYMDSKELSLSYLNNVQWSSK